MRKLWAMGLIVIAAVAFAAPAAAKQTSEKTKAKAACLIAAITWDGTEKAAFQKLAVTTSPFPALGSAKDKSLRTVARALIADPSDNTAAHDFGRWCKSHFPKVSEIKTSSFSVPRTHVPTTADFAIGIDVLSKQCFGSAGCNLTYKINVTYNGLTPLDPSKTYTVVYDVAGGESPITANFTIKGTQIMYHNGFTQTPKDSAVLTATPTNVFEGG